MSDRRRLNVPQAAKDSAQRKVNLTLGVSGTGEEQVNVLINALAHVVAREDLEMASIIFALTDIYLELDDKYYYEEEDDDD
jgi:hypothetical protein|tara:strand:- start:387 stop:629 length:243 start_codon:yes stop_codon:yes gene_type:complete